MIKSQGKINIISKCTIIIIIINMYNNFINFTFEKLAFVWLHTTLLFDYRHAHKHLSRWRLFWFNQSKKNPLFILHKYAIATQHTSLDKLFIWIVYILLHMEKSNKVVQDEWFAAGINSGCYWFWPLAIDCILSYQFVRNFSKKKILPCYQWSIPVTVWPYIL